VTHKNIWVSKDYYSISVVAGMCNLYAYFSIFLNHDIIFFYNIQKFGTEQCSADNCTRGYISYERLSFVHIL